MNTQTAMQKAPQPGQQHLAKVETGNFPRKPGIMSFEEVRQYGLMFFESGMFTDVRSASQAMVKIQAGAELGFAPFASISGVHIIKGKPSLGATLQASLIKDSTHYRYKVHDLTRDNCKLEFFEKVDGKWGSLGISEFSQKDAEIAGLAGKDGQNKANYQKYGRNMLFSRALTNGMRWYTPDLLRSCDAHNPVDDGFDVEQLAAETAEPAGADETADPQMITGEIINEKPDFVAHQILNRPEDSDPNVIDADESDTPDVQTSEPACDREESRLIDLRTAAAEAFNSTSGESRDRALKFLGSDTIGTLDAGGLQMFLDAFPSM